MMREVPEGLGGFLMMVIVGGVLAHIIVAVMTK